MKTIKVFPIPSPVETEGLVVLVDILRATSTIVAALAEEATLVKPVASVDEALLYKEKGFLVAGERGGLPPEGFDLGNSPREAYRMVRAKVVLTTTNGTRALGFVKRAKAVCAGSFLNISAVSKFAQRFDEVLILCAGTEGELALEDFLFAGKLALKLESYTSANDAAIVARKYADNVKEVSREIFSSHHARNLIRLGFKEDVSFCTQEDLYQVVPILTQEGFVALKGVEDET